jgi:aldose sugar dehydrogenase
MNKCVSSCRLTPPLITIAFYLTACLTIPISLIDCSYGTRQIGIVRDTELTSEEIVTGLKMPTSMAFLGQDDILVTEKNTGNLKRIVNGTAMQEPLLDVNVANRGERGLLGLAISHPNHSFTQRKLQSTGEMTHGDSNRTNTSIFLYFTESQTSDVEDYNSSRMASEPLGNRLYRYELVDNNSKLINPELLLDLPASPGPLHNGGVIKVRNDGGIYLTIGDVRTPGNIQEIIVNKTVAGILRITADGTAIGPSILKGNESLNKYYAYGIRNSFGMDFDPLSGNLWDTENGQTFGDEINLVEPGFNSGWRKVQGIWMSEGKIANDRYLERELEDYNGEGKYRTPELTWNSSVGLTALSFLRSEEYGEEYENDMFVGEFHNGSIYHFELNEGRDALSLSGKVGDKIVHNETEIQDYVFGEGFGGITDLEVNPYDGLIYVLSFDRGAIYRIVPVVQ